MEGNMKHLHIDIETYCDLDIKKVGVYKYIEDLSFEILLIAYAIDDDRVQVTEGTTVPIGLAHALRDPKVKKHAHNATFERLAFNRIGMKTEIGEWECSMVKAAYCGFPLGLGDVSKAMDLGNKAKLSSGTALINYFCKPCKPTKVNGGRTRNHPEDNPEKWEEFKGYCVQDVVAEREVSDRLGAYTIPKSERINYILDQEINDRGVQIDTSFAQNAYDLDQLNAVDITAEMKEVTGLANPNSPAQIKKWLGQELGRTITTLGKDSLQGLIEEAEGLGKFEAAEVVRLRQRGSKTSIKKYTSMINVAGKGKRARGLFQFYGAFRTGRWAGRLIQLQNLPRNYLKDLEGARGLVERADLDACQLVYGEGVSTMLSELIRTAFVAKKDHVFAVADFSAIEARVISWLADEKWRLNVFSTHGKIYEASIAAMLGIDIEDVTKDQRARGKVAELALGYQGASGALAAMGAEAMGLSGDEMKKIVKQWRRANPLIVKLWAGFENKAKKAMQTGLPQESTKGIIFDYDGEALEVKLPSGRSLYYRSPSFTLNKFGMESIQYMGMNDRHQWAPLETYGGKLAENITQAIARDLLAEAMLRVDREGFDIVGHVHDEILVETKDTGTLDHLCETMSACPKWAKGLPLGAEGFISKFYKKD